MCVLLLALRVPMSWHKAYLGSRPTSIDSMSAALEPPKLARLPDLLSSVIRTDLVPLHLLRKLTGKLLWVRSLFRPFRPSLAPLYRDQGLPPLVHVAVSPDLWARFRSALSPDLCLQREVGLGKLKPAGISEVPAAFPGKRRIWISVRMPTDSDRKLSPESREILSMWQSCLAADTPTFALAFAPLFHCEAFADACADSRSAGIGGFVRLELCMVPPFLLRSRPLRLVPQKFIAAWELFGQLALVWCVALLVSGAHPPLHFISRCDNAPSDSASWKGISTARGLCSLLRTYFATFVLPLTLTLFPASRTRSQTA